MAEQPILIRNCLRAVVDLWGHMQPAQQAETRELVSEVTASTAFAPDVLLLARATLDQLKVPQ